MKRELMTQIVEFDKKEALETFSNGFQRFLDRTGLKVKDIAKELGVTDSAVSSWKYWRAFPDYPKIFKLLEMGMTLDEIEKEIANLNNKIEAILVRIPECKSS